MHIEETITQKKKSIDEAVVSKKRIKFVSRKFVHR